MLLAKLSAKLFAATQAFLSISNNFDLLREVVLTNWYGVQFLESSSSLNGDSRGQFLTFLTLCTPVDDMDCILQLNGDGRSFRLSCLAPFLCPTTLCRVGEKKTFESLLLPTAGIEPRTQQASASKRLSADSRGHSLMSVIFSVTRVHVLFKLD